MKTQEELDLIKTTLQAQYKTVYTLSVPIDEDETVYATVFLKKADRNIVAMVTKIVQTDTLRAVEAFLKAVYIGGDDLSLILTNDDALMSTESAVVQMLERKKSVLKKN